MRLVEVGLSWPCESFVMLKLLSLAEQGVEVCVGSFPSTIDSHPEPAGITVETLPAIRGGARAIAGAARDVVEQDAARLHALLGLWRRSLPPALWRLHLQLVRLRPDVLHFEWLSVAARCLPLLRAWHGPVVVSCRGSELPAGQPLSNHGAPSQLPGVFARADAVHVVSEAKRDEATAHGLDPAKSVVIRPAVDPDFFRPLATPRMKATRFSIVSVGWLRWLKGYEYALLALADLVEAGIPAVLDILGGDPPAAMDEPSQRTRILHTARDLGLEGHVRLRGHMPPRDVRRFLQHADVLLHSSFTEGLPNVVLEAMACGVPVVATDVGGTREAVRDGVEGFLLPPRDPGAAAAALRRLWVAPELRERMGRAGRARVEAEFTVERQTEQWLSLYERVVNEG